MRRISAAGAGAGSLGGQDDYCFQGVMPDERQTKLL
jgi:hypothetical protein